MNELVRGYAPGSPEREQLRVRIARMEGERLSIPLVIGGKEIETGKTFEAVMPHRKSHVLAEVAQVMLVVGERDQRFRAEADRLRAAHPGRWGRTTTPSPRRAAGS